MYILFVLPNSTPTLTAITLCPLQARYEQKDLLHNEDCVTQNVLEEHFSTGPPTINGGVAVDLVLPVCLILMDWKIVDFWQEVLVFICKPGKIANPLGLASMENVHLEDLGEQMLHLQQLFPKVPGSLDTLRQRIATCQSQLAYFQSEVERLRISYWLLGDRGSISEIAMAQRVRRKTAARPESAKEILSIYGLNRADAEEEMIDPDVPADQAGDVDDFGVIHDSQSEIEISSEAEEPAAAKTSGRAKKAYIDPAVGCYIRLQADGQEVRGELSEGAEGVCVVRFPSEMPFQSEESPVSEEHGSDSGREKDLELEAAGPKTSASSDALLFQGYDITGMPTEAHPSADASGKRSYTVPLPDGIAIDVLVRKRAFWIKKPVECRSQFSWSQYDNLADAWSLAAAAAAFPVDLQVEEESEPGQDPEVQVVSATEGGGPRIEEIPSSDEEANAFIFGLEKLKKKQVRTYLEYEDARHAWESASQEKKAEATLRTAIKLEKEHSYGSPKAAAAAQVGLEEGQKWQSLRAKRSGEEPAMEVPDSSGAPEQADTEQSAPANDQGWDAWDDGGYGRGWKSSGHGWKSGGRKNQQSSSSWQRDPDHGPSRDATQKYNDYEEEEDRRAQAYWGTNQWQRDYAAPEDQQAFKKSKGKKRQLWLASQIETLKKQGRWVWEAEAKQIAAKERGREGSEGNPVPAVDAAADEAPDPGLDSMESFRSMVSAADTIEHVDSAFKRLKSAEAESAAQALIRSIEEQNRGPQNKLAKAMAAKSKAQQQAKVKTEKATPKRSTHHDKEIDPGEGPAIFKLEGIDETGLDEDVKKELLEELLIEAEKRYNYERSTKIHPKFDVLSKYFYVHSAGHVARQGTKAEESLGSQCAGMKNLQLKDKGFLDIMLGKNSGSSSSKDPALQPSESFARAKELVKKIVAEKKKLTQSNEDDVDQAITGLEDFLSVLRQHEAENVPADVTSDCTDLVATFHSVVDQAASHDKGSKALLKKVHGLME
ncbi:hypothetical protein AK812_SmicGene34409 [Symbiodinium microadriaticum]|uniref:Uncharacterized protein n=1 Tax=Symbiodinium microadriaticum TaxID=2951 RepID=A0A1Q9CP39_SYMMI|nr:hypothetical protein AK812_SmicGene34409 [Symbiodinium microadriaticum]